MKFTAFGSITALVLISVAAAAPPSALDVNPAHHDAQPSAPGATPVHHDTQPDAPPMRNDPPPKPPHGPPPHSGTPLPPHGPPPTDGTHLFSPRPMPVRRDSTAPIDACVPSNCKSNKQPGDLFCGNEAVNPNCLNGHIFTSNGDGSACDGNAANCSAEVGA
ncbi:hypothetical protein AX14_005202 [Amanita brunnescens Koide BX004]|nr:hypothetical protein AX14_005202 [Amanita brunnescens Koide BX004]